ncbi:alpha/beta hydrolase-fold protein [Nocardiopsis rhodophaea]|uniref:Alpha/beta hydrolase-fold protein n=1 Tax=Nocardiopsis rhodophaea TaxID=280238 RepID=A0ABN2TGV7_9ACTN
MELTSTALLAILGAVAALTTIGVVVFWRRAARPGLWGAVARLGMLGVSLVCVIAAVAALTNTYFSFFGTWDALLGRNPPSAEQEGDGGAKVPDASTAEVLPGDDITAETPKRVGTMEKVKLHGVRSGLDVEGYVFLPTEYSQPEHRGDRFPVGVVLSGFPGEARNLVELLNLPSIVGEMRARDEIEPTIWVLTRPTVAPPRDTLCVNVPDGPQAQMFFAQDLPEAIADRYRTAQTRDGWAIMGVSSGGSCALRTAMMHPGTYRTAVGLGADLRAVKDSTTGDLYGGSAAYRKQNDLRWRVENAPPPPIEALISVITDGSDGNPEAPRRFARQAKPPMQVDLLERKTGGHNFDTWRGMMSEVLPWVDRRLQIKKAD